MPFKAMTAHEKAEVSAQQQVQEARVEAISAHHFAQQRRNEARAAEQQAQLLVRYARRLACKFGLNDIDFTLHFWGR